MIYSVSRGQVNKLRMESVRARDAEDFENYHLLGFLAAKADKIWTGQIDKRISGVSLLPKGIKKKLRNDLGINKSSRAINKDLIKLGYQECVRIDGKLCYFVTDKAKDMGIAINDPVTDAYHRVKWDERVVEIIEKQIPVSDLETDLVSAYQVSIGGC